MRTLLFLILLVVYVLSAQPVTLLVVSSTRAPVPGWLEALYKPVGWLHDSTPLKSPLDAWARIWLNAFKPVPPAKS